MTFICLITVRVPEERVERVMGIEPRTSRPHLYDYKHLIVDMQRSRVDGV